MNRIPSKVLGNESPHEILFGERMDLQMIKVFGSLCFANTSSSSISKLDSRARKCVFLGYKQGVKGFVLLDLASHDFFLSQEM